jgi:pilus assembly protein CpaD
MKAHPCLVASGLLLALAACQPGAAEYTNSEAPKGLVLDNASSHVDVRFAPGSSHLSPRDAGRLRWLAASGGIVPSDRITVATAGSPTLAKARFNTIAALLLPYGVVASQGIVTAVPANHAIVDTGRYLVTLPKCPDWSKESTVRFDNAASSNFGCATMADFGLSVASPSDLAQGRPVGLADAVPAAAAVQRYQADKVQLPAASAGAGPITPAGTGTTGGGTGAGSAGSEP